MKLNNCKRGYDSDIRMIGYEQSDDPGAWICYFWFVGWDCISLGVHVCRHNVELHLPFGFIRIGRRAPAVRANPFIRRK